MRRLVLGIIVALILWGISQNPGQWADAAEGLGDKIGTAADGFGTFLTRLLT